MTGDLHHLLLVFTAYIVGAASPGPSNMRIMAAAMTKGRASGMAMAAGVISGSFFWGAMAATGISAILTRYAHMLMVLKICGGIYLLYLAIKAAKSALLSDEMAERQMDGGRVATKSALYRRGLLMHLTNPKALLGWIATMTLGLGPTAAPSSVIVILAGCAILSVTIFGGYALVFSTAPMVRIYRGARRWIETTLAAVYGLAGVNLLMSRS